MLFTILNASLSVTAVATVKNCDHFSRIGHNKFRDYSNNRCCRITSYIICHELRYVVESRPLKCLSLSHFLNHRFCCEF